MSNKKKIIDLIQSHGLFFPTTEKAVEAFESNTVIPENKPLDWDAPEAILRRGKQKIEHINVTSNHSLKIEIEQLRMVARKGSELSQNIIDQIKAKHKKE